MGTADWNLRLKVARSNEHVFSLACDFVAQWSPEELSELPESCRPHRLRDSEDLALYALTLAWEDRRPSLCNARLTSFAAFFAAASIRISEIVTLGGAPKAKLFVLN
jgi:hypothetical protein